MDPIEGTTEQVSNDLPPNDSQIFGVSIRAWITVLLIGAVITLAFMRMKVEEPLYSLSLIAAGFYFGQKNSKLPPSP